MVVEAVALRGSPMNATIATRCPAEIEATRRRFERWPEGRKSMSPIPELLWAEAVKLAGRFGISRIAQTLAGSARSDTGFGIKPEASPWYAT